MFTIILKMPKILKKEKKIDQQKYTRQKVWGNFIKILHSKKPLEKRKKFLFFESSFHIISFISRFFPVVFPIILTHDCTFFQHPFSLFTACIFSSFLEEKLSQKNTEISKTKIKNSTERMEKKRKKIFNFFFF